MLTRDDQLIVQNIFERYLPDATVIAFGSRANGTARPYSDLDLAVIWKSRMDFAQTAGLREAFDESDLVFKVDIVDWYDLDDGFRAMIRQEGKVVFEPTTSSAGAPRTLGDP